MDNKKDRGPIRLALTGGIGSGKSAAMSMLAARGVPCLDTDRLVHDLLEQDEVRERVAAHLGIDPPAAGEEGRRQLAAVVFADGAKLHALEEIIFPLVRSRIIDWFREPSVFGAAVAAVEIPLLFESGMEDIFDQVVLITAPAGVRRARTAGTAGSADFERRSARQLAEAEKLPRAQIVFENSGSLQQLEEFVRGLLEWLQSAEEN